MLRSAKAVAGETRGLGSSGETPKPTELRAVRPLSINGYRAANLDALTDLIQKRSQTLAAIPGEPPISASPADTGAGYGSFILRAPKAFAERGGGRSLRELYGRSSAEFTAYPAIGPDAITNLHRTRIEKACRYASGRRRSERLVLVRRDGNEMLLQSRMDMQRWGVTGTTNGQEDIYRGHTFVRVDCTNDMSRLVNGQFVTIPAEQALRIISVTKNSEGRISVEASF